MAGMGKVERTEYKISFSTRFLALYLGILFVASSALFSFVTWAPGARLKGVVLQLSLGFIGLLLVSFAAWLPYEHWCNHSKVIRATMFGLAACTTYFLLGVLF